jgi:hypothetical protein
LDLLFIHHSCGGQWLAPFGSAEETNCICAFHPNGGGLRLLLERSGYQVHEASYGSRIGQHTDIFDWPPKFRNQMDEILRCDMQDTLFPDQRRNLIVMFKSCYPNNAFRGMGTPPGDSSGPELTVWNARAAYSALLDEFRNQPRVLFVCVTAPPLAQGPPQEPMWRYLARRILGRPSRVYTNGPLAREFNRWLSETNGWLKDYPLHNVVVFDYYDLLTGNGASDYSAFATDHGYDSHPSREGNEKAAQLFVPFLNQAVRRAGLSKEAEPLPETNHLK